MASTLNIILVEFNLLLYCPLGQQKHDQKKVPVIRSKKDKEGEGWQAIEEISLLFVIRGMKIKNNNEIALLLIRGPRVKQFPPISEIILIKINMQDKENRFIFNFDQIDEVIRDVLLKREIRLTRLKLFDLKTVNFILTNNF